MRRKDIVILLLSYLVFPSVLMGQQLKGLGMLAVGTASRTRLGGEYFQVGDLMYVAVLQPGTRSECSISVHMEYLDQNRVWQPIPTANSDLGRQYRSAMDGSVRDYVTLRGESQLTTRHVSLFVPYNAASLPAGSYVRRYVIRLWNANNQDIADRELPAEPVTVIKEEGRTVIRITKISCCRAIAGPPASSAPPQPIPESVDQGGVLFFDTQKGTWACPTATQEQPNGK